MVSPGAATASTGAAGPGELALIAAMDEGRVIGHRGSIPWHYREDMRHFRKLTVGHAVIMGRLTYESMGKPLPKRRNIVVSSDRALELPGCEVCHGLDEAVACARRDDPRPFVVGGNRLYREALPIATHLYLTLVPGRHAGDTYFPEFDRGAFEETERRTGDDGLVFLSLRRLTAGGDLQESADRL